MSHETDKTPSPARPLFAVGRLVGFGLFAGLGIAVFAVVVLVPAYGRLLEARYERDRLAVEVANLTSLANTRDRQILAIPNDRVYTLRLLASHEGFAPADEVVMMDPQAPAPNPAETLTYKVHPRPARPSGPVVDFAARLENPALRRGLCAVAVLAMATAMFLFSCPRKYKAAKQASPNAEIPANRTW